MEGTELVEVNPLFEEIAKERGFYSPELMEEIAQSGIVSGNQAVPEDVRRLFVCSHDISYAEHVRMQVAFQKHTDNAVSKTINFRESATIDEVREAYLAAWRDGLKGITVYRDNSRPRQVLNLASTGKKSGGSEGGGRRGECCDSPEAGETAEESACLSPRAESMKTASISRNTEATTRKVSLPGLPKSGFNSQSKSTALASTFISLLDSSKETLKELQLFNNSNNRPIDMSSILDCPECGYGSGFMAHQESCSLCFSCGYTMC